MPLDPSTTEYWLNLLAEPLAELAAVGAKIDQMILESDNFKNPFEDA